MTDDEVMKEILMEVGELPMGVSPVKRRYLRSAEAAAYMGFSPKTWANLRSLGENHPPYIKLAHAVLYDLKDLDAYMQARKVDPAAA